MKKLIFIIGIFLANVSFAQDSFNLQVNMKDYLGEELGAINQKIFNAILKGEMHGYRHMDDTIQMFTKQIPEECLKVQYGEDYYWDMGMDNDSGMDFTLVPTDINTYVFNMLLEQGKEGDVYSSVAEIAFYFSDFDYTFYAFTVKTKELRSVLSEVEMEVLSDALHKDILLRTKQADFQGVKLYLYDGAIGYSKLHDIADQLLLAAASGKLKGYDGNGKKNSSSPLAYAFHELNNKVPKDSVFVQLDKLTHILVLLDIEELSPFSYAFDPEWFRLVFTTTQGNSWDEAPLHNWEKLGKILKKSDFYLLNKELYYKIKNDI